MIEGYSLQLKFDPIALSKAYPVSDRKSSYQVAQDFWETYGVPEGVEVTMTLSEVWPLDDPTVPKTADVKFSNPDHFFMMHAALWQVIQPETTT